MTVCKNCWSTVSDINVKKITEGGEEFEVKVCTECMEEAILSDITYSDWLDELESADAEKHNDRGEE